MWSSAQAFAGTNLDTSYRASSSRRTSAFLFPLVANANVANGGEREARRCWLPKNPRAYARRPGDETKAHPSSNQSCPRWRDLTGKHGIQDENWRRPFPKNFRIKPERCSVCFVFFVDSICISSKLIRVESQGSMVLAEGIDLIHFGFQNFPTLIVTKPDNQERCESGGALKLRSLRPGLAAPQISQRPLVPPNPKEETPEICRKFLVRFFLKHWIVLSPDTPTKNRRQLRGETENTPQRFGPVNALLRPLSTAWTVTCVDHLAWPIVLYDCKTALESEQFSCFQRTSATCNE